MKKQRWLSLSLLLGSLQLFSLKTAATESFAAADISDFSELLTSCTDARDFSADSMIQYFRVTADENQSLISETFSSQSSPSSYYSAVLIYNGVDATKQCDVYSSSTNGLSESYSRFYNTENQMVSQVIRNYVNGEITADYSYVYSYDSAGRLEKRFENVRSFETVCYYYTAVGEQSTEFFAGNVNNDIDCALKWEENHPGVPLNPVEPEPNIDEPSVDPTCGTHAQPSCVADDGELSCLDTCRVDPNWPNGDSYNCWCPATHPSRNPNFTPDLPTIEEPTDNIVNSDGSCGAHGQISCKLDGELSCKDHCLVDPNWPNGDSFNCWCPAAYR